MSQLDKIEAKIAHVRRELPEAKKFYASITDVLALLRVARAAQAMRAADKAWEAYIRDDGPDDDARAGALDDMASEAKAQMAAALAALESEAAP